MFNLSQSTLVKSLAVQAAFDETAPTNEQLVGKAVSLFGENSQCAALFREKTFSTPSDVELSKIAASSQFYNLVLEQSIIGAILKLGNIKLMPLKHSLATSLDFEKAPVVVQALPVELLTTTEYIGIDLNQVKVGGYYVLQERTLKQDFGAVQNMLTQGLVSSVQRGEDQAFIDYIKTGSTTTPATANIISDIVATGTPLLDAVILMHPNRAFEISNELKIDSLNVQGGTLKGVPVITSNAVLQTEILVINKNELILADDAQVEIRTTNEASVRNAGVDIHLFQQNLIAIMGILYTGFKLLSPAKRIA